MPSLASQTKLRDSEQPVRAKKKRGKRSAVSPSSPADLPCVPSCQMPALEFQCTSYAAGRLPQCELARRLSMRHLVFFSILLFGASLGVRAEDQGPVEKTGKTVEKAATKTGKTVEHAASATGKTVEHGTQATERTVGKGLEKTGKTLEKAGHASTHSSHHHARTKASTTKSSPSPSPNTRKLTGCLAFSKADRTFTHSCRGDANSRRSAPDSDAHSE